MEKEEVRQILASLIEEVMPALEAVDMEKDIVTEYGINSVSIIRLIVAAEEQFDIQFTDYELALDSYDTFGDLAAVIKDKLDKKDEI
jgi:acyl carrier protein